MLFIQMSNMSKYYYYYFFYLMVATSLLLRVVPLEAGIGFLVYLGVLVTAQAFAPDNENSGSTPTQGVAVALGLLPCLSAWGLQIMQKALGAAGVTLQDVSTEKKK